MAFKDCAGREWGVSLNVWLLEQVTARASTDLDNLLDEGGKSLIALFRSSPKVARVLWVLVEDEAKKLGVTEEQFLRSLAGDHLEDARHALYEAVMGFSPPQDRETMQRLQSRFWGEIRAALDLSKPATGLPESSASIPAE
jgi:hypothetical protein